MVETFEKQLKTDQVSFVLGWEPLSSSANEEFEDKSAPLVVNQLESSEDVIVGVNTKAEGQS